MEVNKMSEFKTPEWDDCEMLGIIIKKTKETINKIEPFSVIEGPVAEGRLIKAKYKNRTTIVRITNAIKDPLEGIVVGFEPSAKTA
jgi:hypothetical protein